MTKEFAPESEEVAAAHAAYLATRERILAGELGWEALAQHFTEDAVFIDPAWGRIEGLEAITQFMGDSMQGLEDWEFPEVWTVIAGDRVVSAWWNRLPGVREDGSHYQALGISTIRYAGDGKFDYEHDLLNMAEVLELIVESRWVPTGPVHAVPNQPNRDITPPTRT
jgi:ketosteroid isomerase-like protein